MRAVAEILSTHERPAGSIWVFLPGSLLAHLLVLLLWTGAPPSGMPGGGVLQINLAPGVSKALHPDQNKKSKETAQAAQSGDSIQQAVQEPEQKKHIARRKTVEAPPQTDPAASRDRQLPPVRGSEGLRAQTQTNPRAPDRRQASNRPTTRSSSEHSARRAHPASATETQASSKAREQPAQRLTRRSSPAQVEQPRPLASPTGASQAAVERGGMGGDAYRRIQGALRKALLPRFDYPMLARRRGWEGRVRIGVLVESDGDLRDIHVVESCGYRVLDEAALDDLREVGRLSEVNAWLDGEAISVILPIQYRLK